jgi:hypothetical protein
VNLKFEAKKEEVAISLCNWKESVACSKENKLESVVENEVAKLVCASKISP